MATGGDALRTNIQYSIQILKLSSEYGFYCFQTSKIPLRRVACLLFYCRVWHIWIFILYHLAAMGDENISIADLVPVFCFVCQSLAPFTG